VNFFDNGWDQGFGAAVLLGDYARLATCSLDVPEVTTPGHAVKAWECNKNGIRLVKAAEYSDGAELVGAAEDAEQNGAEIVLIDRNIHVTLKRVWANLGFWTKCQLLGAIVGSMFDDNKSKEETSKDIEDIKDDMNLSAMMDTFAEELPQVHKPLIDERDRYLVSKMRECGGKNVVAVVGAGHVPGMQKYYKQEINREELDKMPKPSIIWTIVKWAIPLIVIGGIIYGVSQQGFDSLQELLTAWILPNSLFCFLAAILALAHPLTILCAFLVSPLTSTTPVIGAGIVCGLLEAWLRKPTVADCEDLQNVHTLRGF
jgi:pheromone shutdown-related protein TraB